MGSRSHENARDLVQFAPMYQTTRSRQGDPGIGRPRTPKPDFNQTRGMHEPKHVGIGAKSKI